MPKFDLLLLPLAAGFVFATMWHPTHVSVQRSSGYKSIFIALVVALCLLAVASLISIGLLQLDDCFGTTLFKCTVRKFCYDLIPKPHSGRFILAALLGFTMWWPFNKFCDKIAERLSDEEERQWMLHGKLGSRNWLTLLFIRGSRYSAISRAITKKSDGLETLLRNSIYESTKLVFTLKSGKVYIGNLAKSLNPAYDRESLHVYLEKSGYYDKDDLSIVFTHDYRKIRIKSIVEFLEKQPQFFQQDISKKNFIINKLEEVIIDNLFVAISFRELQSVVHYHDLYHEPKPKYSTPTLPQKAFWQNILKSIRFLFFFVGVMLLFALPLITGPLMVIVMNIIWHRNKKKKQKAS